MSKKYSLWITNALLSLITTLLMLFNLEVSAGEPLIWRASPSASNGTWFFSQKEAVQDFKNKGEPYSLMTEALTQVGYDGFIAIKYKIPDAVLFVGDWSYEHGNDAAKFTSEQEVYNDLLQVRINLQKSLNEYSCSPYAEIDRNAGAWLATNTSSNRTYLKTYGISKYENKYLPLTLYQINTNHICYAFSGGDLRLLRSRTIECPVYTSYDLDIQLCTSPLRATVYGYPLFYMAPKTSNCPTEGGPLEANPCNPATGNKVQTETDYLLSGKGLKVQRHYASQGIGDGYNELGPRWRHNYSSRLNGYDEPAYTAYKGSKTSLYQTPGETCLKGWNELKGSLNRGLLSRATAQYSRGVCNIKLDSVIVMKLLIHNTLDGRKGTGLHALSRSNGDGVVFQNSSSEWQPLFPSQYRFIQNDDGWMFNSASGATEVYDDEGKLLSSESSGHLITLFTYDAESRLATVTGPFGDRLTYHYNEAGKLNRIVTPDGNLNYQYDTHGRLSRVVKVDGSERIYHYENTSFPHHLTGITDENGGRFASWNYDSEGRAIYSEHAEGAERVEFTYNSDATTTVTDAAGAERTYHFTVQRGQLTVDHIEGDRCTTCAGGGTQAYTYDNNGFIASKTDWNGNTTTYTRDAQGRELTRTEASGTPQARTITTTWDTSLNKPLTVTEPNQITTYNYDTEGRLLGRQQSPIQ